MVYIQNIIFTVVKKAHQHLTSKSSIILTYLFYYVFVKIKLQHYEKKLAYFSTKKNRLFCSHANSDMIGVLRQKGRFKLD